jgi:hypothetical protein
MPENLYLWFEDKICDKNFYFLKAKKKAKTTKFSTYGSYIYTLSLAKVLYNNKPHNWKNTLSTWVLSLEIIGERLD